ncbi:hypothetical protein FY528_03445 [Hymenobacter lutimineralis]|uniref:Uncharacterized protein n=1 Tax=Hymenobacter lutimineralis TaxID=2606448 RepID=A0A5D6VDQ1_9BACT|nr:hypothetical protein [Hymenobacter lutimineralis]TYZ13475.1 hypothetical protein FY528_03445 [Hymenobacter lutimineralis]
MRRAKLLMLLLLPAGGAFGEAFKGGGRLEDFLWGVLLLLVGAPVAIGVATYGLMRLSNAHYTASPRLTVGCGCLTWWLSLLIGFNMPPNPGAFWLLTIGAGAGGAAAGYYLNRVEKPGA